MVLLRVTDQHAALSVLIEPVCPSPSALLVFLQHLNAIRCCDSSTPQPPFVRVPFLSAPRFTLCRVACLKAPLASSVKQTAPLTRGEKEALHPTLRPSLFLLF